jgi:UDP-N-acetyl-2-amino-2-deoxyglucuronate dehydrogenase
MQSLAVNSPNHIDAAIENELEMVALCDIAPENIEDKIVKFDLPQSTPRFNDYKELLEKEKPELIAICTESGKHGHIALDCKKAESNLIIEKPIAPSL